MSDDVWLGKNMDNLTFSNLEEDYDEPEIYYEKYFWIFSRKMKLKDYQIEQLIKLVVRYLKTNILQKNKDEKELKRQLKTILEDKAEIEKELAKKR